MLNISPIGRNCSRDERNAFEEFDKVGHVALYCWKGDTSITKFSGVDAALLTVVSTHRNLFYPAVVPMSHISFFFYIVYRHTH